MTAGALDDEDGFCILGQSNRAGYRHRPADSCRRSRVGTNHCNETKESWRTTCRFRRLIRLAELDVGTLVCGAISRPLHEMVAAHGIEVIPFVAGDLSEVIQAWLGDKLEHDTFAMPGCCGRGRDRRRGMRGVNEEEFLMNGRKRGGMGQGGRSRGQGGQGRGRMGGPLAGGAAGACLCPKCGHRESHEQGVPCVQKQCPKCGTAMTRE